MKKSLKLKASVALMLPLFGLALAAPAYATMKTAPTMKSGQMHNVPARNIRLSQLVGKDVRNAQGEDLGDIKDVIIDVNNSRVHYVVLSFGGFLGMGNKLFAYPVRAFSLAADKDELILNVAKERLKDAPGFEADRYPNFEAAVYRDRVDNYFGKPLAIEPRPNMRLVRSGELIGKDVNGANGRDLGEIQDVVLNMANGNVQYAVLEFDQSWSLNDKLFAFPLRSFKQGARVSEDWMLNISKDTLNNVPGFDKKAWPDMKDPKWNADVDRYLVTVVALPSTTNDAMWNRLDKNKDGWLSADEAKADANLGSSWSKLDVDNKGRISRVEFDTRYRP